MKKRKPVRVKAVPRGLVFVVDDNALLVEFAATILQAAGYSVKHFLKPKSVLAALRKANPKPSVLVTDYDMDQMNGLELIRCSHKIHPGLKTLLVSGTVNGSITLSHPAEVHRFLGKPYRPAQLEKALQELMRM